MAKAKANKAQDDARSNHKELLSRLWESAVNLRGSIGPAEYKQYVLPLIFLRFLSVRYEERRKTLVAEVREPESPLYADTESKREFILGDPDNYRSVGVFPIPEKARWDYLRKHATAEDVKNKLDAALEILEETYPEKLKGLLPAIFASSNLSKDNVTGLVNLFSKDVFSADHGGADLLGKVYEYFIGHFADSEGRRGGEYFTPVSIVRVLVEMLAPDRGIVFDPCCGSGGMFVQANQSTYSQRHLAFYGQESLEFTYRLCRLNLFIHGLDGKIRLGNAFTDDQHPDLKADYVLANPPFNLGSNSEKGWGADKIGTKDPRLKINGETMPLSKRNANTMWMLHFLHHLKDGGTAGFVMATGELSSQETARLEVRKTLIEKGYLDCIVQLTGQLFANTQIPCSLWFLSKNRDGQADHRKRKDEVLFIDARSLGSLIPGSRKQKELSQQEITRIVSKYRQFTQEEAPKDEPGFCAVATVEDIREHRYALTPGRYVGVEELEDDGAPFEERFPLLVERLEEQFTKARTLENQVRGALTKVTDGT